MARFGIDFAWGRPSIAALKAHGVSFVGRYFSQHEGRGLNSDPGKDLSRAELDAYRANHMDVVVAWETTANRAGQGERAGQADARLALEQAHALGFRGPIHFAVDFDANGPDVWAYFRGAHSVAGALTGVYGGYRVVKYLLDHGVAHHAWQTYAWSSGRWDSRALVRQYSNGHYVDGVDCDYDVMLGATPAAPHADPLAILTPDERGAINAKIRYSKRPQLHRHGLKVVSGRIVNFRKAIWLAAEKGIDPHGRRTPRGWGIRNRRARYATLWRHS